MLYLQGICIWFLKGTRLYLKPTPSKIECLNAQNIIPAIFYPSHVPPK